MILCKGSCRRAFPTDALDATDGMCFGCSTGDENMTITSAGVRESMNNIATSLAVKTDSLAATVRKEMRAANQDKVN